MIPLADLNIENLEGTLQMFRFSLTAIGACVMLIGIFMFFYHPKDETKRSPYSARIAALICFGLIGLATIAYAWVWFGK